MDPPEGDERPGSVESLERSLQRFLKGDRGLNSEAIDRVCLALSLKLIQVEAPRVRRAR